MVLISGFKITIEQQSQAHDKTRRRKSKKVDIRRRAVNPHLNVADYYVFHEQGLVTGIICPRRASDDTVPSAQDMRVVALLEY